MKRTFAFGAVACGVGLGCSMTPVSDEATGSTSQAIGTAIYVDCGDGKDTLPGTSAEPVKTIRRAMQLVQAGGAIYIRPGVCTERVDVTKSNIVITRDPATNGVVEVAGNTPIRLDYTDLATCNPGAASGNRACNEAARDRYSTFDLYDVHDVTISGLTITQDQNVYCPADTPALGCRFDSVHPTGTVTTTQEFGHYFQQTCITEGNTCEERPTPSAGYTGLTSGCCIIPHPGVPEEVVCNAPYGDPNVKDSPPHVCGRPLKFIAGISIQGASRAIRIDGNEITRIKRGDRTKWITAALPIFLNSRESDARVVSDIHITNNKIHDLVAHDIDGNTFGGLLVVASDNVDGFEVGNNVITNVGGAISPNGNYAWAQQGPDGPHLSDPFDRVRNSWIHDNRITTTSNYAIYLDGPQRALIERNLIMDSWAGIGVVTEVRRDDANGKPLPGTLTSDVWVRDNVVATTGVDVNGLNGFQAFATGMWLTAIDRPNYNPVNDVAVTNNTFVLSDLKTTPASRKGNAVNILPGIRGESSFVGNIVAHTSGNAASVTTGTPFPSAIGFGYGLYFASNGAAVLRDGVASTPGGIGDATGFVASPVFTGPTSLIDGFHIQSTSPARNKIPTVALPVPSWATGSPFTAPERDGYGGARRCGLVDIGADEYLGATTACVP